MCVCVRACVCVCVCVCVFFVRVTSCGWHEKSAMLLRRCVCSLLPVVVVTVVNECPQESKKTYLYIFIAVMETVWSGIERAGNNFCLNIPSSVGNHMKNHDG